MKEFFDVLKKTALFKNFENSDLEAALQCFNSYIKHYKKSEVIIYPGGEITKIGIVVKGTAQIIKEDISGNRNIIAELKTGGLFGEALAFAEIKNSPVTVTALTDCSVIFVAVKNIITTCPSACQFHTKIIENMIKLIAGKNIALNNKIDILSKKTIREKLLSYFELESEKAKSLSFKISFSREELADYLCVNRSALSRELCNMQSEGIIEFKKNNFAINKNIFKPY